MLSILAASISKPVNKVQCSHEGGTGADEAFGFVTSTWFVEFDDEFNGLPYSVCPMEWMHWKSVRSGWKRYFDMFEWNMCL